MKEISVYRLSVRPRCQRLVHESAEETALDVERARARNALLHDIIVDIDAPHVRECASQSDPAPVQAVRERCEPALPGGNSEHRCIRTEHKFH